MHLSPQTSIMGLFFFFLYPLPRHTDINTAGSCLCLQHKSVVNHEWVLFCIVSRRYWAEWVWWIDPEFRGQMSEKEKNKKQSCRILGCFFLTLIHALTGCKRKSRISGTGRRYWLASSLSVSFLAAVHYAHAASCFCTQTRPLCSLPFSSPARLDSRFRGPWGRTSPGCPGSWQRR